MHGGASGNEAAEVVDHDREDVFVEDIVLDEKELVNDIYFLRVSAIALGRTIKQHAKLEYSRCE